MQHRLKHAGAARTAALALSFLHAGAGMASAQTSPTRPASFDVRDAAEWAKLFPADAKVVKLAGGMKFLEGPVYMPDGVLLFSDQLTDKTMRWTEKDGAAVFREPGNGCNGNTLDLQGRRITCEGILRRLVVDEPDGTSRVLVDGCDGKKFNSPNDVVVKSDGTVWFTDPPYWLPKDQKKEMDGNHVFCFDPATKRTAVVARGFDMPNGLCFSPDETKLYVADSGKPKHVRAFEVKPAAKDRIAVVPWELAGGDAFCKIDRGAPDGVRCDADGRLWSSAGDGIQIFGAGGQLLGKVRVPESPANLCFGGPDGKTLFITARTSLYSVRTNVGSSPRPAVRTTSP